MIAWIALALLSTPACASSDYVEVLVGGGEGGLLPPQGDYRDWKVAVAFGEDLEAVFEDKLNLDVPGEWSFRWMPFASYVSSPEENFEVGVMASLKLGIPLDDRWKPYIAAGTGPMYTSQDTREQATRFNFVSYGALGVEYKLDARQSIALEGWRRHFSNASLVDPNDGVDTSEWYLTYTLFAD